MKALRVTVTHFDTLENSEDRALCVDELGTFVNEPGNSARDKVKALFEKMEPACPYLGWDGNVYPTFQVEKVELQ